MRSLVETPETNPSSAGVRVTKDSFLGLYLASVADINERGASAVPDADLLGIGPFADEDGMEQSSPVFLPGFNSCELICWSYHRSDVLSAFILGGDVCN